MIRSFILNFFVWSFMCFNMHFKIFLAPSPPSSIVAKQSFPRTIIIGGPTASGKTILAVHLAEKLRKFSGISAEIINADSIQMYKDLKILTAFPSEQEFARIPHHLFGILEPQESSSIASWLDMASKELKRLKSEQKIAIFCGGTGFYLRALFNGVANIPEIPHQIREEVWSLFAEIGRDAFFEKLKELDFESAQKLHKNDTQRILRAYEVAKFTGKTLGYWWENSKKLYDSCNADSPNNDYSNNNELWQQPEQLTTIVLLPKRELLKERSENRIKKMLDRGAIEEVIAFNAKNPNYIGPLQEAIGYREICEFLLLSDPSRYSTLATFASNASNNIPKNFGNLEKSHNHEKTEASYRNLIQKISTRTNQYIKRQSTWFRNQLKHATFIENFGDSPGVLEEAFKEILSVND